jgi:hypothetical protein
MRSAIARVPHGVMQRMALAKGRAEGKHPDQLGQPHMGHPCWPPPRLALGTVPEVPHRVDEPVKVHGVSPSE